MKSLYGNCSVYGYCMVKAELIYECSEFKAKEEVIEQMSEFTEDITTWKDWSDKLKTNIIKDYGKRLEELEKKVESLAAQQNGGF